MTCKLCLSFSQAAHYRTASRNASVNLFLLDASCVHHHCPSQTSLAGFCPLRPCSKWNVLCRAAILAGEEASTPSPQVTHLRGPTGEEDLASALAFAVAFARERDHVGTASCAASAVGSGRQVDVILEGRCGVASTHTSRAILRLDMTHGMDRVDQ